MQKKKLGKQPKQPTIQKPGKQAKRARALKQSAGTKRSNRSKKSKRENQLHKKNKGQKAIFGIQNKLIICFLVPILFMVILGFMSYKRAESGMSETFCNSTQETVNMAMEYVDVSNSFIEAEALKYVIDSELGRYFVGIYDNDPTTRRSLLDQIKNQIQASQVGNEFISNIYIITESDRQMISTKSKAQVGIYEDYMAEMRKGKSIDKWVDEHKALDEYLRIDSSEYILSCQMEANQGDAVVVVDIKRDAILEFLQGVDLGDDCVIGFVTAGGSEIAVKRSAGDEQGQLVEGVTVFADKDFYQQASESSGAVEVEYDGEKCLFFQSKSDITGASVCGLVPMDVVTGQAEAIKQMTIVGVIIASIIVIIIGLGISSGIRRNMKRISGSLEVVAEGNLTTMVSVTGRDEFRGLAAAANDMIAHNKKLVQQVSLATDKLEVSAGEVTQASGVIQEYSLDITNAIQEINDGMEKQSIHAQECVSKTDTLSQEIQDVSRIAQEVESLVANAEEMIQHGMDLVTVLGERARETTEVTAKVGDSIEELKRESEIINQFVGMITDISEQTNLLSLNASIEAARAGEAGKGFAVVAEEIRKLADNSAQAAGEIRNNVANISAQTVVSVESAKQAGDMVALQTEAVKEVTGVFQNMNASMKELFEGLKQILIGTERADKDREDTLEAVRNISMIIEETAESAEVVKKVAENLQHNVENLNGTAESLGDNMSGLKTEISVFKTE